MTSSLSAQTSNDCYTAIRVKGLMYVFCVRSWNITLWGRGSWDLTVGFKDLGSGIDRSTPLGYFWV